MTFRNILLAGALAAAVCGSARAQDFLDFIRAPEAGAIVSMESILDQARDVVPGTVTEIELERKKGAWIYEVEVTQPDGVKMELIFDARSGKLLSRKRD